MRTYIKTFSLIVFFFTLAFASNAQEKKIVTSEFEVTGVCKMCKARIEEAALIKGVKLAEWDKNTQMLKVIYKTKKVSEEDIHAAVAAVGHDTEKIKATDEAYDKLPGCCGYRDGVKVH